MMHEEIVRCGYVSEITHVLFPRQATIWTCMIHVSCSLEARISKCPRSVGPFCTWCHRHFCRSHDSGIVLNNIGDTCVREEKIRGGKNTFLVLKHLQKYVHVHQYPGISASLKLRTKGCAQKTPSSSTNISTCQRVEFKRSYS